MEFVEAGYDPISGLRQRHVSAGGLVQIGVFPVMFGVRIRAGFVADRMGVWLDWCAGDDADFAAELYGRLLAILSDRPEDEDCFDGLPRCSAIKPAFNDPEFMRTIRLLYSSSNCKC